jgi:hypothetical protein
LISSPSGDTSAGWVSPPPCAVRQVDLVRRTDRRAGRVVRGHPSLWPRRHRVAHQPARYRWAPDRFTGSDRHLDAVGQPLSRHPAARAVNDSRLLLRRLTPLRGRDRHDHRRVRGSLAEHGRGSHRLGVRAGVSGPAAHMTLRPAATHVTAVAPLVATPTRPASRDGQNRQGDAFVDPADGVHGGNEAGTPWWWGDDAVALGPSTPRRVLPVPVPCPSHGWRSTGVNQASTANARMGYIVGAPTTRCCGQVGFVQTRE